MGVVKHTELDGLGEQPISIVIPCQAEYIGLCRLLAGVVGARASLSTEDIADFKLVVTEACTCFLAGGDEDPVVVASEAYGSYPESLRVDYRVQPDGWEVVVSDPDHRCRIPNGVDTDASSPGGLGLTIMRALVDTVECTYTESDGSVIRMTKQTHSPL